jgi:hypothetical protein
MPLFLEEDPTALFQPVVNSEYRIAKYLDLAKFISLLQRQSLFFCRMDKLEDQFEGTVPKNSRKRLEKWFIKSNESAFYDEPIPANEISKHVDEIIMSHESQRSLVCLDCWTKFQGESAALWKIYSDSGKGIMIKSSTDNLKASLGRAKENIRISEVRYIDYDVDTIDLGNFYNSCESWVKKAKKAML